MIHNQAVMVHILALYSITITSSALLQIIVFSMVTTRTINFQRSNYYHLGNLI